MVIYRFYFLFFLSSLVSVSGYAQVEDHNEIKQIVSILTNELEKTGIKVPSVFVGQPTPSSNGIFLQLIENSVVKESGLYEKPAESFSIKIFNDIVLLRSTTTRGLKNGVYWYLNLLGFRYYFPNKIWHHVPSVKTFFPPLDRVVTPSFQYRRIWYAYGTGSKTADRDYDYWVEANLLGGDEVSAGHSYEGIVNRNKKSFLEHPEYFAQKVQAGIIPPNPKFEVGNEALVQLIIADVLNQVEASIKKRGTPPAMISLDPSDGGGYSTTKSSLQIGGPSEQVFYLANRVAKILRERHPSVRVGLYAYNYHAAPPRFAIESNITVLIATSMNKSAFRTEELIEMWQKKKVVVGIRDYFGVMAWDWDMPGQPSGSKLTYVSKLKNYHQLGVRLFSAETNVGWISRGLGHFIAAQMLWDVTLDPIVLKRVFHANMFGEAASEMEQLFDAWQRYNQPIPLEGDLYHWYDLLERAGKKDSDNRVQARITQVKKYLHYVYLFRLWKNSSSDEKLVKLLSFAYRVQHEGVAASYPLFRRLANAAVKGKANMKFDDPAALWKMIKAPVTPEETERTFKEVFVTLDPSQRTVQLRLPKNFSGQKSQNANSKVDEQLQLKNSNVVSLRGGHTIVFQLTDNTNSFLKIVNGLIKAHQYKKLVLKIFNYHPELSTSTSKLVLKQDILPEKSATLIPLSALKPGIYMAFIDDAKNGFRVSFSGGVRFGIVADDRMQAWTYGRNNLVFDVQNVKSFSIRNSGPVIIKSPNGRIIDLQKKRGLIRVNVHTGEEGIWQMIKQSGVISLQGILPLVSPSEEFLLQSQ
ncbi:DUF4838 domain-containing protein [Pseudocnuella soli]|uniref:DUF4838 domain-containing protein n=1 Tax=Pseudocnuella soli TaxID=2502779 RepID=UPI001043886B|nr:DUF4838 domain-containing protein [Pseudocnuella soli]